jgi:hypothetical protein
MTGVGPRVFSRQRLTCAMFWHAHVINPDHSSAFVGRRGVLLGRPGVRRERDRAHLTDNYVRRFDGRVPQKIERGSR